MRNLGIGLVLAVVLVSGCVQFDEFSESRTGIPQITVSSADIQLDVEAFPTVVKAGRNVSVYFDVWNKHQDMGIKNLDVSIYDPCVFTGDSDPLMIWTDKELLANRTDSEDVKLKAGDVDFDRDCQLRFSASYETDIFVTQSVSVLQESEYYQREGSGTLANITSASTTSSNPLSIVISFAEQQPFLENEKNIMYIDYSYSGDGYIDSLPVGSIKIYSPDNMRDIECNDYVFSPSSCTGTPTACEDLPLFEKEGECEKFNCYGRNISDDKYDKYECIKTGTFIGKPCVDYHDRSAMCMNAGCEYKSEYYSLNREKTFINKQTPRSTCTFTASASQPIDTKTLQLEGTYKYSLDNSLLVKVKPR